MTTIRRPARTDQRDRRRGQALVEFSLALIPFLLILMGIFDLGRGIYMNSGVNQAAREIARTTAVHPCTVGSCTLGNSSQTLATIAVQKGLVPGMKSNSVIFDCTTVSDQVIEPAVRKCQSGDFVRITVSVPFAAITPLLSMVAPSTLVSTAHVQVP